MNEENKENKEKRYQKEKDQKDKNQKEKKQEEFYFLNEKVVEKRNYNKLKNWLNIIFSGILFGLIACGICFYVMWTVDRQNRDTENTKGEILEEKNEEEILLNMDLEQWRGEAKKSFVRLISQSNIKLGMIMQKDSDYIYIVSEEMESKDSDESRECEISFNNKKIGMAELVRTDKKLGISMWRTEAVGVEHAVYKQMKAASISSDAACKEKDMVMVISMNKDKNVYYLLGKIKSTNVTLNMEDGTYNLYTTDISSFKEKNGFALDKNGNVIGMMCAVMEKDKLEDSINLVNIQSIYKDIENLRKDKARAVLGIEGSSITKNDSYHFGEKVSYGVWVSKVTEGSAAYGSGIMVGDIITALDGYMILDLQSLKDTLLDYNGGDTVEIEFLREEKNGYQEYKAEVTLE